MLPAGVVAAGALALAGLIAHSGSYGLGVILRREPMVWVAVALDDARLSPSMRLALQSTPPDVVAGPVAWERLDPGFEVGELPVLAPKLGQDAEVDRILLARIDPARFTIVVRNLPSGDRDTLAWMRELGAVLVINGSYFSNYGTPDTPTVSAGVPLGPTAYDATHGALVVSTAFTGIRDLAKLDWHAAFRGADDAVVSYPLLIGADGQSRSKGDPRWLANRSFVAQDAAGRILFGTTVDAFFSLDRLAAFLRSSPLDLKLALNLDGGPIACQAIAFKGYKRDMCGQWETSTEDGKLRLLTPVLGTKRHWGMPNAIAVVPR
jgi:hypothetical protein